MCRAINTVARRLENVYLDEIIMPSMKKSTFTWHIKELTCLGGKVYTIIPPFSVLLSI